MQVCWAVTVAPLRANAVRPTAAPILWVCGLQGCKYFKGVNKLYGQQTSHALQACPVPSCLPVGMA